MNSESVYSALDRTKILKPSLGLIEKFDDTWSTFYSIRGSKNESRSEGASSMLRKISHMPCSAATVKGPFLNTNSPVSLHT